MAIVLKRLFFCSASILILFIPKKSRKRFFPVSIFSIFLTTLLIFIGKEYEFWKVHGGGSRKFMLNATAIFIGAFPFGNFLMFHLFYGSFKLYLLGNFILNSIYAFIAIPLLDKIKYVKYVKFTKIHHIIVTMTFSVLAYGFQNFLEKNNFMKKKLVK
jgi:hypothetical protein